MSDYKTGDMIRFKADDPYGAGYTAGYTTKVLAVSGRTVAFMDQAGNTRMATTDRFDRAPVLKVGDKVVAYDGIAGTITGDMDDDGEYIVTSDSGPAFYYAPDDLTLVVPDADQPDLGQAYKVGDRVKFVGTMDRPTPGPGTVVEGYGDRYAVRFDEWDGGHSCCIGLGDAGWYCDTEDLAPYTDPTPDAAQPDLAAMVAEMMGTTSVTNADGSLTVNLTFNMPPGAIGEIIAAISAAD